MELDEEMEKGNRDEEELNKKAETDGFMDGSDAMGARDDDAPVQTNSRKDKKLPELPPLETEMDFATKLDKYKTAVLKRKTIFRDTKARLEKEGLEGYEFLRVC